MKSDRHIESSVKIFLLAIVISCCVLAGSLVLQWIIYDDWLHRSGPLRIVGTSIATVLTFVFMLRWQYAVREREREMIRRFETISQMNDRIRNALQAIECVTYVSHPNATDTVSQEVDAIDRVLREVLADAGGLSRQPQSVRDTAQAKASPKSA